MSSQPTASSPLPSSHPTTPDRSASQDPSSYKCSCGAGNGTGDYIQCDNEKCPVGWYHWECVHVTEEPIGTWLCPSCSPSAAFYVKQLVKKPAPSAVVPESEGKAGPSGVKAKELKQGPLISTAGKAATLTTPKEKETNPEVSDIETAKKGIATKKPAAQKPAPEKPTRKPKPKQRWLGWVEMSSDGEEEFKKAVDAQWGIEDSVPGNRRRASKGVVEEDEAKESPEVGSRSRVRRNERVVEDEEEEDEEEDDEPEHEQEDEEDAASNSMYQEEEDEEDIEDSEMQMYPGDEEDHDQAATSSSDEASLGHEPSVEDEDPHSAEDSEDSMDIDQESSSSSDSAAGASNPSHTHEVSDDTIAANGADVAARGPDEVNSSNQPRSRASSSSHSDYRPAPSSPILDDDDDEDATTPRHLGSQASSASEDSMEVDTNDEHQEHQPLHIPTLAAETINLAARYQRQGNPWVEFPESAIRSTLPRLA